MTQTEEATYVRYTPNPSAPGYNANAKQRVIELVEAQVDPMEPARHKHKKVSQPAKKGSCATPAHASPLSVAIVDAIFVVFSTLNDEHGVTISDPHTFIHLSPFVRSQEVHLMIQFPSCIPHQEKFQ